MLFIARRDQRERPKFRVGLRAEVKIFLNGSVCVAMIVVGYRGMIESEINLPEEVSDGEVNALSTIHYF